MSAASNVSPMPSPSPSSTSLNSTLPRSPLRKTATSGYQHPLATVSTFESDPAAIPDTTEDVEDDKARSNALSTREQDGVSTAGTSSIQTDLSQGPSEESTLGANDMPMNHLKDLLFSAGHTGPSVVDKKQGDLRILKSAILSGSHNIPMLQIKSGAQMTNTELATAAELHDSQESSESDWVSVAVTSGDGQPLSPLTASYPVLVHHPATLTRTPSVEIPESNAEDIAVNTTAVSVTPAPASTQPTTAYSPTDTITPIAAPSSPKRVFEMWTPPPPRPRPTQEMQRAQPQPQHHSRLHFPRLLNKRSFNFSFISSSSSPSSSTTSLTASLQQGGSNSIPAARASVDDSSSSQAAGSRPEASQDPATRAASRSHGGELERFSPGWVVVENSNQSGQNGPTTPTTRRSMSDDRPASSSLETHQQRRSWATTSRRHVSLGVQPKLTSMWGRLLTSILPSGNDHHAQDSDGMPSRDRETATAPTAIDGDTNPYLQQQRLLLTPLSQQQQVHPLYQQQLFFYADEVVSEPRRVSESSSDQPGLQSGVKDAAAGQPRWSMANESLRRADSPSLFPALAHNVHLQGELAQEDCRESLEMSSAEAGAFMRPELSTSAAIATVGSRGETVLAPRSLSADGKIPVSSLALSSPPSYWEAEIKYRGWPKIEPRPEQGHEALPRYTCSVFREGCVNRKTEIVGSWRPYRRPWKRTFAHLRGTALRLYAVDMEDVPRLHVRNISLQLAKCEIATDYKQRPNVIRIRACDRTVLLECKDRIDALTWLEHLQAAANIATSLEDRSMPKFYTLPRAPPQSVMVLSVEFVGRGAVY
ncbi:hypothetical protein BGX29_009317 [Mortierella sp. GBA35]|nr:hypothetical protein BGX29_009317 [Mortierella sp. GBA35]